MVITSKSKLGSKVILKDVRGNIITSAYSFNTKTNLVKCYVIARKGSKATAATSKTANGVKAVKVSFYLKGAKLFDKKTGKEVVFK